MGRRATISETNVLSVISAPPGYEGLNDANKRHVRRYVARSYNIHRRLRGYKTTRAVIRCAGHSMRDVVASYVDYEAEQKAKAKAQAHELTLLPKCGAKTKRTGAPCKSPVIKGRKRCKMHGGKSTGPQSLEGRIRALRGLKQYKGRPDLLEARISKLRADWTPWPPDYAPQGYEAGETLPPDIETPRRA